jgi:hypothetical protein
MPVHRFRLVQRLAEVRESLAQSRSHEKDVILLLGDPMAGGAPAGNLQQAASHLAGDATRIAQDGGRAVDDVVQTMNVIKQSSDRITSIIAVIDGLAFQTNILALNAAVESACAEPALGPGHFSVQYLNKTGRPLHRLGCRGRGVASGQARER